MLLVTDLASWAVGPYFATQQPKPTTISISHQKSAQTPLSHLELTCLFSPPDQE
jgi:hypothetical protein